MRTLNQQDKFRIAHRDNFTCQFCGDKPGNAGLEVDHIIPVSKYGSDNDENLITTCKKCNRGKRNLLLIPHTMCEGEDTVDEGWIVHRSFGQWQVKFHPSGSAVLEFTPRAYWIEAPRAHSPRWEEHIEMKRWCKEKEHVDLIEALAYFRRLIRAPSKRADTP